MTHFREKKQKTLFACVISSVKEKEYDFQYSGKSAFGGLAKYIAMKKWNFQIRKIWKLFIKIIFGNYIGCL